MYERSWVPDWDADGPELRRNLATILEEIVDRADLRETPSVELARDWQRRLMQGLNAEAQYVGAFRGEPGLEKTGVKIGAYLGTPAGQVNEELKNFEQTLQAVVNQLDRALPVGKKLNADQRDAVIDLCA